jgi:hypothetical protein
MTLRTRIRAARARCSACAASPRAAQESTMRLHPAPDPPRRDRVPAWPDPARPEPPAGVRHQHRERDFGIGYGNSSGYGCDEHFVQPPWGPDRFRCL